MLNRGEEEWKQKKELIKMSSLLKRLLADKDSNLITLPLSYLANYIPYKTLNQSVLFVSAKGNKIK